jgi:glutaryl-CoA dehydrogenase
MIRAFNPYSTLWKLAASRDRIVGPPVSAGAQIESSQRDAPKPRHYTGFVAFRGVDYLLIDSQFSGQELMVRQTARRFVDERVLPLIRDCFRDGRFPRELIPEMAALGFLGANLEGYGCAGMRNVEYGLIMQEIERGDSGLRSFVSVQGALVMYPILQYGSEEQKERWLPRLQSGDAIGCFGLTEPGFGSNPAGMLTRAVRQGSNAAGSRWVLNGEKTWITNGSIADVAVVWARTVENGESQGIRGFLVERDTPGFSSSDIHGKWSMRASVTSSLAFTDCELPDSAMLPGAKGLKAPLSCLSQARHGIGWGVIGAAMECYETARSCVVLRKQFDDRPLASHQLVQEKLAWMITEITKAQLLALQCGRLKDSGKLDPSHISMLKRNNAAMALECARLSRDLLGANGITDEYPIMRHLCNLETVKTYEGTDHIHALVIGERVTSIAAWK